jgi:hypothetical protein
MHAPTLYSAVFLLHAPVPAPIKIGFDTMWCDSYDDVSCVGKGYTPLVQTSLNTLSPMTLNALAAKETVYK